MENNADSNVDTDSAVDLVVEVNEFVDPMDPIVALHVAGLNNGVDPVLVGAAEVMAVGPRTDADERQIVVPEYGQVAEGFQPSKGCHSRQPSVAVEAIASSESVEHAVTYPIGYLYCTLAHRCRHPEPHLWTVVVNLEGSCMGPFEAPHMPGQCTERASTLARAGPVPTTVSAQMAMTATLTSTVVTFAAAPVLWNLGKPSKIRPTVSPRQLIPVV